MDKNEIRKTIGCLDRAFARNRFADTQGMSLARGNKIDKFLEGEVRRFEKWNGIDKWTEYWKDFVANREYVEILENCLSEKPDGAYLGQMGISEEYAQNIKEIFEKHGGYDEHNVPYLALGKIEDKTLQRQLRGSLQTVAEQTVITPNIGNTPRYLKSFAGTTLFNFQTFSYGLFNETIKPLVTGEYRDPKIMAALGAYLGAGILSVSLRKTFNGEEINPNSLEFWVDVIKGGGILDMLINIPSSISKTIEDPARGLTSFSQTAKFLADCVDVSKTLFLRPFQRKSPTYYQAKRVRDMTPGLNYWYLRPLSNGVLEAFPGKRKKQVTPIF